MSDSILDPSELEAIQSAIRESGPTVRRTSANGSGVEPTRLALIADDRIADAARPALISLANRWARTVPRALRTPLPGSWQLDVMGAEVIEGLAAKEELRGGWISGAVAGTSEIVVAVHGGAIDVAAARRCGAATPTADPNKAPSQVSLRLFEPTGRALLDSLDATWSELFDGRLVHSVDLGIVARLIEARTSVRVTLAFSGSLAGRIQLYARPESIVARPQALAAHRANIAMIASALANVTVEVTAVLGTLRLSLGDIRQLDRDKVHVLPRFVDSRVPVFCGGVLKAWARPVVCRGVLAVQIISVVHGQNQGTSS